MLKMFVLFFAITFCHEYCFILENNFLAIYGASNNTILIKKKKKNLLTKQYEVWWQNLNHLVVV